MKDKTSIMKRLRTYRVSLGNGVDLSFSNFKEAYKYISKVNDQLTYCLIILNDCLTELLIEYRRLWFYFDNRFSEEKTITDCFQQIDKALYLAVERSHWDNGNFLTFSHFQTTLKNMRKICTLLMQLHIDKNNFSEKKIIQATMERISWIEQKISEAGK